MMRLTKTQYRRSVEQLTGTPVPPSALPLENRSRYSSDGTSNPPTLDELKAIAQVARTVAAGLDPRQMAQCGTRSDSDCADRVIEQWGLKVYRRPLEPDERARLRALYQQALGAGPHVEALRAVVQVMLQSPRFLYQIEPGAAGDPLDGFALAQRLSLALWNSPPSDALLAAAQRGALDDEAGLRAEAAQMLAAPNALHKLEEFHLQWLSADAVTSVGKVAEVFPSFTPTLAAGFRDEAQAMIRDIFTEGDGRFATLFRWNRIRLGPATARAYGLPQPVSEPTTVERDPTQHAGVLTLPAVMAVLARPAEGSPIKRGNFVYGHLLCGRIGFPSNLTLPPPSEAASTRERVEAHTSAEGCASCHRILDPPGFALEHFDGMGLYRTDDHGKKVDAHGGLEGSDRNYVGVGAALLGSALAESAQAERCYTKNWLDVLNGEPTESASACGTDQLSLILRRDGVRAMLLAAVTRPEFRLRGGD
ncbi:MAG: DUF1592 domain-containing protein [Myxococcaceae bacterium]|nr:DUF1592 domain-containing protein [Myxococcaceae bacterium]